MLKCLLYRHFVAPEIWHLSCDKLVLQTRIEPFDSTFSSGESNTQSKDHDGEIYLHITLHFHK